MPYVRRDARGAIESVHRTASPEAMEYLDAADAEVAAFFDQASRAGAAIDPNDLVVFDEALDILLAKGLVSIDDLSKQAQAAWLARKDRKARQEAKRFVASGFVEIIDDSAFTALAPPGPAPERK